jgi:predicted kinase
VPDLALIESLDRLLEGRLRQRERDVVDAANVRRRAARIAVADTLALKLLD